MIRSSAIYVGAVQHHRLSPREHRFRAGLGLVYLDLDELDEVFRLSPWWRREGPAPASFRRRDYLPDGVDDLAEAARQAIARRLGFRPEGAIRLLTSVRHFGHLFNPVSFFYAFDRQDRLAAVLGEITNTPWGERHCYAVDLRRDSSAEFPKRFHVSPFMGMDQTWRWHCSLPGRDLRVGMRSTEGGSCCFTATLALRRRALTAGSLNALLCSRPLHGLQVLARIHWEALRLWWKDIPFHPHPRHTRPDLIAPA